MIRQKYYFEWLDNISYLIFPRICLSCGNCLNNQEDTLCIACLFALPISNFHLVKDNPVAEKFAGRIPIHTAFSYLFFDNHNTAHMLLHQLKYHGRQDLGERLGVLFGNSLKTAGCDSFDVILPLPLHPAKEKLRGFNQCHSIARGMCAALGIPSEIHAVKRVVSNSTQTNKGRYERWENVAHIFQIAKPDAILGKHVLLLDDVVTTGSTLEACGRVILAAGASTLSIAALASA